MSAINVRVRLFGDLRKYVSRDSPEMQTVSLPAGSRVTDVLATLGVAPDEELTPGLNGQQVDRETLLNDGDELLVFGPMEGG